MWDAEFGKRVRAASFHEASDGETGGLRLRKDSSKPDTNTNTNNGGSSSNANSRTRSRSSKSIASPSLRPQQERQQTNGPKRSTRSSSSTSREQNASAKRNTHAKAQDTAQTTGRMTRSRSEPTQPQLQPQPPAKAKETKGKVKNGTAVVLHSSPISSRNTRDDPKQTSTQQNSKDVAQRHQHSASSSDPIGVVTRSMARKMVEQEREKNTGEETLQPQQPSPELTVVPVSADTAVAPITVPDSTPSPITGAHGESNPASPENHYRHVRRSPQFNYDRFIPARSPDPAFDVRVFEQSQRPSSPATTRQLSHKEYRMQIEEANRTYDALLRSELLNDRSPIDDVDSPRRIQPGSPTAPRQPSRRDLYRMSSSPSQLPSLVPWSSSVAGSGGGGSSSRPTTPPTSPSRAVPPMLQYRSPRKTSLGQAPGVLSPAPGHARNLFGRASPTHEVYQQSPIRQESRRILSPRQPPRRIAKDPVKVLDTPGIRDDYYLNLLDWSSTNKVAVALNSEVYIWDAKTSQTNLICDVSAQNDSDWVTSVKWAERGKHLAIGLNSGLVQVWDVNRGRKIRDFAGHSRRVGVLEWNGSVLSSGSRDKKIFNRDTRMREGSVVSTYYAHTQEVCGLQWSPGKSQLASGGNDNLLLVWDTRFTALNSLMRSSHPSIAPGAMSFRRPLYQFAEHTAAVKALAWSPTQSGLLASGGGTDDRCIRMWNTQTGQQVSTFDTGSQVCNLSWSFDGSEIVSTHGYSQNHIIVWKYPAMQPVGILTGHTKRVLYLAHSPDGQTIASAAGDETLRFWNVFPKIAKSGLDALSSGSGTQLTRLPGGGSIAGAGTAAATNASSSIMLGDLAHIR